MTTRLNVNVKNSFVQWLDDNEISLVVIDNGSDHQKFAYYDKGQLVYGKKPSFYTKGNIYTDAAGNKVDAYTVGGETFNCSSKLTAGESTVSRSYQTSNGNIALIGSVLDMLGLFTKKVILITTMPVKMYFDKDGKPSIPDRKRFADKVVGEGKIINAAGEPSNVILSFVVPESFAAIYHYIFTDELVRIAERAGEIDGRLATGIVDIGGYTADVVTMVSVRDIDHSRSDTLYEKAGCIELYQEVEPIIKEFLLANYPHVLGDDYGSLPREVVHQAIEGGNRIMGAIDISPIAGEIAEHRSDYALNLIEQITKILKAPYLYGNLFLAGGGSHLFLSEFQKKSLDVIPMDEYSIALGALKMVLCTYKKPFIDAVENNLPSL